MSTAADHLAGLTCASNGLGAKGAKGEAAAYACASSGETATQHVVRELPPKAPRSSIVSRASWYLEGRTQRNSLSLVGRLRSHGLSVASERLDVFSRVRRAARSLRMQAEEPAVASGGTVAPSRRRSDHAAVRHVRAPLGQRRDALAEHEERRVDADGLAQLLADGLRL